MSYAERTVAITTTGAPAWFAALADKTWTSIARGTGSGATSGATIYQVRPSTTVGGSIGAGLFAYSGGCVDQTRGELLIHGGGHGDYAGNEVYGLCLRDATPSWTRLIEPSPGVANTGSPAQGGSGQYTGDSNINGYPAANHTANNIVFANGKIWLPRVWGMFPSANGTPRVFWFDRTRLAWTAGVKWRTEAEIARGGQLESNPSFYIALDDVIITGAVQDFNQGVTNVVKLDARTGAVLRKWTDADLYPYQMPPAKAVVLPGTRLVVFLYPTGLRVWDFAPSTPVGYAPSLVDSTSGLTGWMSEVTGMVYHAPSNALLCGNAGGEYFVAIPVPANPRTNTWTASRVTPANVASGSRIVPPASSYVYGRFNLIDNMGDGRSALVYLPSDATEATYVMALPTSGVF